MHFFFNFNYKIQKRPDWDRQKSVIKQEKKLILEFNNLAFKHFYKKKSKNTNF